MMSKTRKSADNLNAISVFVTVAEGASLTSAAQKLQMSVSGVSKAISRLEEHLQTRLLNRTSRRITLTDEGATYFKRCRQVLLDLEEAAATITQVQSQPRGRLRLLVPRGIGRKIVIPSIGQFLERFPDVAVDVILDARSLNLEEEGIDIALRYDRPADSLLIARKLCRVSYLICASPGYIRANGEPKALDDLRHHRCINYIVPGTGRYRQWNFYQDGNTVSLDIEGALNVNDMGAVVDAAVAGAGLAYLPDFMVAEHIEARELQVVLPDCLYHGNWLYAVYPRRRYTSPRFRVFFDYLHELFPTTPWWQSKILGQTRGAPDVAASAAGRDQSVDALAWSTATHR
jgi:LysR family transcriptional regulator for bpeEF and oprC